MNKIDQIEISKEPLFISTQTHLNQIFSPRLIRIHGSRNNISATLVHLSSFSLNKNDCFILDDAQNSLHVWRGKNSNMFVKIESTDLAVIIKDSTYNSNFKIIQVEQGLESPEFWELLGGKKEILDNNDTTSIISIPKIVLLSKTNEFKIEFKEVAEGINNLKFKFFNSNGLYFVDLGFEIFVLPKSDDLDQIQNSFLYIAAIFKKDRPMASEIRSTLITDYKNNRLFNHFVKQ